MKHQPSAYACAVLALVLPFFATSLLCATTLAQLSLEQLTSAATVVTEAKCTGVESRWRDGEIWTVTSFRSEEIWKGNLPEDFQVWMLGGRSGSVTSYVPGAPRFRPGEEVVLFLEPTRSSDLSITAWGEGTFRIHRDLMTRDVRVTQDTASITAFDPIAHSFRAPGIHDWPLEKLKARVFAAESDETEPWRKQ